jgi:hypothetical protein
MGTTAALGVRHCGRLRRELVHVRDGVLGEGAWRDAVDLVAGGEPGHAGTGLGHRARDVAAQPRVPWATHTHRKSDGVRLAGHEVLGATVEPGGVDAEQHLPLTGAWDGHVGGNGMQGSWVGDRRGRGVRGRIDPA